MKASRTTKCKQEPSIERLIDAEAERLVLGNILDRGGEFWKLVGPQLDTDCFAVESNRRVFVLMKSVADRGSVPDLSGCLLAVIDQGKTPDELGLPLLSDLAYTNQVELTNPLDWVKALQRKSAERRAWRAAERLRLGIESGEAPEEIANAREELRSLEASFNAAGAIGANIADAVHSIGIDTLLSPPRGMVASPWERLNVLTNGGLRPGELWLLASRPSVGKTTAALQWAITAAAAGQRVLFARPHC